MPSDPAADNSNRAANALGRPILDALGAEQNRRLASEHVRANFDAKNHGPTADRLSRLPERDRDAILDELLNSRRITRPQLEALGRDIGERAAAAEIERLSQLPIQQRYDEEPDPPPRLHSRRRAMENLGVEDPEGELRRIAEERGSGNGEAATVAGNGRGSSAGR